MLWLDRHIHNVFKRYYTPERRLIECFFGPAVTAILSARPRIDVPQRTSAAAAAAAAAANNCRPASPDCEVS